MKCTKLLLSVAAAAIVALQPAHAEDMIPYRQFTLSNGLRVVVHEDHKTPKVAVSVWYHVGSMNEPEGKSGFAHLYEHLMFNGSENHNKEYMPPLQEIGASGLNGSTAFDQTYYYEIVPTGGLERVLWLESDRMGHMLGAITQAKLDEQRAVVQNEKRTHENQPYALMDSYEAAGIFPVNHPYYHPTIGSMEDLNGASLEDVKAWFRQYYGASNAVVSLSGDVTYDQAKSLMEKYFGSVPPGPPVHRLTAWVPTLAQDKSEVMQDNVPHTAIAWTWPVPGQGTRDAPALRMAAEVLGRGKTSRLYKALVHDRQIATSVSASYSAYALAGIFSIDVKLKEGIDRAQVETVVNEVLRDFLKTGPTEEEMRRAKTRSYADTARSMESIFVKAMALADGTMFYDNPGEFQEEERRFEAVTAAQARMAADSWLTKGSFRLTVLPFGQPRAVADAADRTRIPALAPSPGLTLPVSQEARLSNGIRVVFSPRPGTPTVEVTMVFNAGRAADTPTKKGLNGFTMSLMDSGPQKYSDQAFEERQAALGARLFGYHDADSDNFALSALTRSLPESIDLWAEYIRDPAFRPADLERERTLSLSALTQSLSNPEDMAQRTFTNMLYGRDHAYGLPLAGRADTLKSFTRDDLVAFYDRWIRPDNAVIYASGDTTLATLTALLEKSLGSWKAPVAPKGEKSIAPLADQTVSRIVLIDKPGSIQSVIRVGQLVPSGLDPRDFDIEAMNDVLGGSFTARLNMNLREAKGWTYGANSLVADARGPQAFMVTTNIQTDKTAEALTEIDKEIRAIRKDKPVTQQELDMMTKGQVLALPGQFETNDAFVRYLRYVNRFDRPYDYITTLPAKYAALKPETITQTADATLHPDALTWVVVGDLEKIEPKVRALNMASVEIWDAEGHKLR